MNSFFTERTISKALIACCFVFWVSTGLDSKASASCGDYLRHKASILSKNFSQEYVHDGEPGKLPGPSSRCKNGNCGQAPPVDSARIAKLDASHFNAEYFFALGITDKFESLNDESPLQPTLDLIDPPPRTLAL